MRFGLDRMRRMMTVLGSPERRFASIHVVGTNGKSSTTRMIAAILERHGLRTGAYLSPHLVSYTERVQIGERDISMHAFAAAVARAAWAAERVNRTLAEDDHVTQFELLTAAAFWALAERGVEVAVVEAGLGGRYDATTVIESERRGADQRRASSTRAGSARRCATSPPRSSPWCARAATLVLGADLDPEALALARDGRGASARLASCGRRSREHASWPARGAFQRRNFALARTAAEAYLAAAGIARARGGGARRGRVAWSSRGACRCSARTR